MDTAKPGETEKLHDDHFTTEGQVESGKRYAAAMIEILNEAKSLSGGKPAPAAE